MVERLADSDKIVTRYMADREFQDSAFPILAKEIFDAIHGSAAAPASAARDAADKRASG